eukprot:maker-scaffold_5-snap-gene-15.0-mRNA-1 protein AED:0.04 eAED:0.04 QI:50/0.25/0.2/0.6/1/1/5/0/790
MFSFTEFLHKLTLDGETLFPFVALIYTCLLMFLSTRIMSLRLFPKQRTTDAAFFIVIFADLISYGLHFFNHAKLATISSIFLTPAGPFYILFIFFPQQVLQILSLTFQQDIPFHAAVYTLFFLTLLCFSLSSFLVEDSIIAFSVSDFDGSPEISGERDYFDEVLAVLKAKEGSGFCDDSSYYAQVTLLCCFTFILISAFRSSKDRLNFLILSYSFLGFGAWANCAKNLPNNGLYVMFLQCLTFLATRIRIFSLFVPGTAFNTFSSNQEEAQVDELKKARKKIKKIAMVLDGFIGPQAVVCGISRSYEAWIKELVNQGVEVVIYSAFDKHEIENYFHDPMIKAYQLEALDIKYVQQVYYATRINWANIKTVSKSFHAEKIDLVHVVFDGASSPLFSWACALTKIPIVGIMHTDTTVICERNGFHRIAPLVLFAQKSCGVCMESIATRSQSFAEELLKLRNWKVDHIIKPHVSTHIFKPTMNVEVEQIRRNLTFAETLPKFDESKMSWNDEKLVLLYVGRFDIDKRFNELLVIINNLREKYQERDIFLALIGAGSLSADVESLHGSVSGVFCKPKFLSHEELSSYYNAADLHISCSQMETLGNTVLESLACGTPVIVPRAQGFVDTVSPDENGIFWECDNLDDALTKILSLHHNRPYLAQLKQCARRSNKNLACSNAVEDLLKWYVKALDNRKRQTLSIPRVLLSSGMLFSAFWFDCLVFSHAKKVLQSFSNDEVRKTNLWFILASLEVCKCQITVLLEILRANKIKSTVSLKTYQAKQEDDSLPPKQSSSF